MLNFRSSNTLNAVAKVINFVFIPKFFIIILKILILPLITFIIITAFHNFIIIIAFHNFIIIIAAAFHNFIITTTTILLNIIVLLFAFLTFPLHH